MTMKEQECVTMRSFMNLGTLANQLMCRDYKIYYPPSIMLLSLCLLSNSIFQVINTSTQIERACLP